MEVDHCSAAITQRTKIPFQLFDFILILFVPFIVYMQLFFVTATCCDSPEPPRFIKVYRLLKHSFLSKSTLGKESLWQKHLHPCLFNYPNRQSYADQSLSYTHSYSDAASQGVFWGLVFSPSCGIHGKKERAKRGSAVKVWSP